MPLENVKKAFSHLPEGSRIVAGISGGADSMALLLALHLCNLPVTAVHFNFSLRGEESDSDEEFVKRHCAQWNVPLISRKADAAQYAGERQLSIEMACRELRYDFFEKVAREVNAQTICVAHNAGDNAETLLLNLMRGAGSMGLSGMAEACDFRGLTLVRPLLKVSRKRILEFLNIHNVAFRTDSTNLDSDFRRNFLRNKVIPLLQEEWPEAAQSILASREILEKENLALTELAGKLTVAGETAGGLVSDFVVPFARLPRSSSPLLHRIFAPLGANSRQIREMAALCLNPLPGRKWILPRGSVISFSHGLAFLSDETETEPEEGGLPDGFVCEAFPMTPALWKKMLEEKGNDTLWLPENPRSGRFRWAHPSTGDKISPLGMKAPVLVSKICKDAKLNPLQKARIWLLKDNKTGEIIWIPGLKRSKFLLADPEMTHIFRIFRP